MTKRFTIRPNNRSEVLQIIAQWLQAQAIDTLPLEVVVKPYKRNRSVEQNALLWKLYSLISDETGHSKDEIHDLMRWKFLGMQKKEVAGTVIEYLPSTTKLKVSEMADYITQIEAWAANLGIRLGGEW